MALSEVTKEKLKLAKENRGKISPELLERVREISGIHKSILDALGAEAKTIPDLALATGLPPEVVFWNVNALRKYNKIHDVKKCGSYFSYAKK